MAVARTLVCHHLDQAPLMAQTVNRIGRQWQSDLGAVWCDRHDLDL